MAKIYATASDLPGQYRRLAEYADKKHPSANPHALIYGPLDVFYDFLVGTRVAEDERLHATPAGCACLACAAKAGRPAFVQPLRRAPDSEWLLWGDGHYVITDGQGRPITQETPCEGVAQSGCPCYWCRPYHYDESITNRRALEMLLDFITPMAPVVRGRRLEQERARITDIRALLARLDRVEQELQTETYQPGLLGERSG